MVVCVLCGFSAELDDAAVVLATRPRCICIRCFARATGGLVRQPPQWLRREVEICVKVDV